MSECIDHDYQKVYCKNCGGYCGQACTICEDMTDGGEHTYITEEWCKCENSVPIFEDGEEEELPD